MAISKNNPFTKAIGLPMVTSRLVKDTENWPESVVRDVLEVGEDRVEQSLGKVRQRVEVVSQAKTCIAQEVITGNKTEKDITCVDLITGGGGGWK